MKILVVEDEHRLAVSIQKGLEQENFSVDVAFNGEDGLDQASTVDYDVLILDLMLPGLNGLEICKQLRDQDIHTPILMLTAKSQLQDKLLGFKVGADDYLSKPFAFEELLARVKSLSKRGSSKSESVLQISDLTLNNKSFAVSRSGQEISLTSKEFVLLEYLLRHQNQILTKEQIISYVWDYDSNVLPNTIEVYIKKLRNKIDLPFPKSKQLIHTIRGFGYKLSA